MSKFSQHNFANQKALVRVDFNVPLDKVTFEIKDDTRIKAAIPTIEKILEDGGSVILMSHMGRPKDGPEAKSSLQNIIKHVSDLLGWSTPIIQLYKFDGIPYTVLIDREGKIIATGLRGIELEQKLKEALAK